MTTTPPPLSSAITLLITFLIATTSPPLPLVASSTIAVTHKPSSTTTICGITAGKPTQSIQCYHNNRTVPISPNVSYESISGGRDLFCGLRTGGFSLICWDTTTFLPKRIYFSHTRPLTGLTVGTSQICAIRANNGVAMCWRFQSPDGTLKFRAITSGGGFSCGILENNSRVICWGGSEIGAEIQRQFGNLTMLSLVAGESHACGLATNGYLICKGSNASGQLNAPSLSPFEISGLALGSNHSCGILQKNGSVICWGGGTKRSELSSDAANTSGLVSFEAIEAGSGFTCGLTTRNLSLVCWGLGFSSVTVLPLAKVIPGPCIQSSCSSCGVFPNSDSLCAGSGNICQSCAIELPIPVLLPASPASAPRSRVPPPSVAKKRFFLAFGIVGSVGGIAGICTIVYWLWRRGFCNFLHKKFDRSLQPPVGDGSNVPPPSSNGEKSQRLRRQRSGTSSKHIDRVEEFALIELSAATNNFSFENKIGGGSFGTVYKGKLPDGREVAIKRSEIGATTKKFQEKEIEFDSELASLSRLHHKHLVELVGFCKENDERLLVYEHMSNGSLYEHLKENDREGSNILNSWKMRIKIALETARGIEYLHNYAVPPIIHRDIKSSNILLDANWTAKVSDFGFSLMGPEADTKSMSTKAVGTVGYIDPEYYGLNILTAKSDVYGLGVVLLELLTGKRAMFKVEGLDPMTVVEYAGPRIAAGELQSVLDKRVGVPNANEAEAVEVVAYAALKCVNLEGNERPSITDVVVNLERAMALCEGGISSTKFFE
ncbi:putative serine/threonine-protein kinase-like protein CCR3 [Rhododendron vialii]|uniref:putative serine/threonine-protein kinase-like protein CCR3 n=1 Tax=Rhododendron vialii TaxID=182163 RepID=UPI00265E9FDC|nr:putative serine/threonine-protein kinase-like protein CCR3 [Rhododendron vialii]